jgi:ABC-type Fe3+ transport system substrate-binding protein
VDVVYGGGPIFERMEQMGLLEPCRLPDDVLDALPATVAGQPLYDPKYHWYGAAISTFGLIFNKTLIREKDLPAVTAWADMADPRFFGLVGAGDPTKSGSMRKAYEIILQAYGYEEGMGILVKMGANAREFSASSSDIPRNCAQGFLAVGPCIDFYAQRQMRSEGGEKLGFVAPEGLTVVNCDPIGILKNAPNRDLAEAFVEFVMSPAGQRLWMFPVGAEGGPREFALERLAARPSVYEDLERMDAESPMNPFRLPEADFYSAEKELARLAVMPAYLGVALVENHGPLVEAWRAILDAGGDEEAIGELTRPLISEAEMLRLGEEVYTPVVIPQDASPQVKAGLERKEEQRLRRKSDLETRWSETLRDRYQRLAEEAATGDSP